MARPYSPELLEALNSSPDSVGKLLGRTCLKLNLPMSYIHELLGVSRMTLHSWYRGSGIRKRHESKVDDLLKILEEQTASGRLPAKDLQDGKDFIEFLTGKKLSLTAKS